MPSLSAALAALLGEDADVRRSVEEIRRVRSPDLIMVDSAIAGLHEHPAIQQLLGETGITAWRERARGSR